VSLEGTLLHVILPHVTKGAGVFLKFFIIIIIIFCYTWGFKKNCKIFMRSLLTVKSVAVGFIEISPCMADPPSLGFKKNFPGGFGFRPDFVLSIFA
jgi:hypothetical protein